MDTPNLDEQEEQRESMLRTFSIVNTVYEEDWQDEPESNKIKCHKWHLHCDACRARRCPLDYIEGRTD